MLHILPKDRILHRGRILQRGPHPTERTASYREATPGTSPNDCSFALRACGGAGGIYLDPLVWAPPVEQTLSAGRPSHVRNPATGRMERMDLSNALLREAPRVGGEERAVPVEEQPPNVDFLGQVRGRCLHEGCTCAGFVRREHEVDEEGNRVGGWVENDRAMLRCGRCDCECHEHAPI